MTARKTGSWSGSGSGVEQLLLGVVVVIHQRRVDIGSLRGGADRGAGVAVLGE
jgi:hypothetical protein